MAQKIIKGNYDFMNAIHDTIAQDNEITSSEVALLLCLHRFMDKHGVCYPSYKTLMAQTKLSDKTITKNIASLASKGWLVYTKGDKTKQQANTYRLNLKKIGLIDAAKPKPQLKAIEPPALAVLPVTPCNKKRVKTIAELIKSRS